MIEFKKPTLEDRDWINSKLKESDFQGCEYTFGNLFIWRNVSDIRVAQAEDFLCITSAQKGSSPVYSYPVGKGDEKQILERLMADAKEKGIPCRFRGIFEEQKERMEALFPGAFTFHTNEGDWDYVYEREALAALAGKKFHGKRNHIARFRDGEDWSYEPVTGKNVGECALMNEEWCKDYGCGKSEDARIEQCAVKQALEHFEELSLKGGLLRKAGKVVAFTIGEPLNSDTYVVHIEKAFPEVQGAYPMINQQFVLHNMQDFRYVNREEDMGDEGLRKAKMSYKPVIRLVKYKAATA